MMSDTLFKIGRNSFTAYLESIKVKVPSSIKCISTTEVVNCFERNEQEHEIQFKMKCKPLFSVNIVFSHKYKKFT